MCACEPVDGLVNIADCEQTHAGAEAEPHHHAMQSETQVLILVDGEDRIFGYKRLPQPRIERKCANRKQRHIVEIDQVKLA